MSLKKLGRYDLIRVLGKGAMGLVYEGRDPNLERRVAIKTIKVENLSDEAAAEYEVRFRTEARSAARLQHPNIVSVYDSDRDIDIAYLVMEFVEGEDLKHHLDNGQSYTLEQTQAIMADLLSALSYAHRQNVVHRDVKPANLLVIAGGHIKLADFGVARIQDSGDATRTQGTIIGTLKYMSPEQLEGKPIDARTDLFAAGVVLYQLLTGERPFDGETDFAVIQKIVSYQPPAPTSLNPGLPPALDAVIAKSLAKARDARYASAQEFSDALQAACKQAGDMTISPVVAVPAKGSNTTWTATMKPGESLIATRSGDNARSSTGTGTSLVTQEVELVYWKDIKESSDASDFLGFLDKFPAGIYADLARRRIKNLGMSMPSGTQEAIRLEAGQPATDAEAIDKTPIRARAGTSASDDEFADTETLESAAPVLPRKPESTPDHPAGSQAVPAAAVLIPAPVRKNSRLFWLGALLVLACVAIAFKMLNVPASGPAVAIQTAAPVMPAAAVPSSAPVSPAGAASMAAALPAMPVIPAISAVPAVSAEAPAMVVVAAPAGAASTFAKPSRPAASASKAFSAPAVKMPVKVEDQPARQEPARVTEAVAPAQANKPAGAVASSPKTACEGRVLFGFQSCMSEQCAKTVFTQHPQCIERRIMDENRQEAERNR